MQDVSRGTGFGGGNQVGAANCSMWNIPPLLGNQHVPRGTVSGPFAQQFSETCSMWNAEEPHDTQLQGIVFGLRRKLVCGCRGPGRSVGSNPWQGQQGDRHLGVPWQSALFHVERRGANGSNYSSHVRKAILIRTVRRPFRLSEYLLGGDAAGNGALGWIRASPMWGSSRSRGGREPQSRG